MLPTYLGFHWEITFFVFHPKVLESELQRMAQEAEFMKEQEEEARIVLAAARAVSLNY